MTIETKSAPGRASRSFGLLARAGVVVLGVGLLAQAVSGPMPQWQQDAFNVSVTPQGAAETLVCVGQFRVAGRDASSPLSMTAVGTVRTQVNLARSEYASSDLLTPDLTDATAPLVLSVSASGDAPPRLSAAQSSMLNEKDAYGLAAAACRPPALESWLIGGSAAVGASDLLVLSNPGDVAATVTITVFGAAEPRVATAFVAARSQVAMPLASYAGQERSPVIHLSAEGSQVHAVLQSNLMRTLDPVGVAIQDGAAAPAMRQVMAGVQVAAPELDEAPLRVRMMATEADGWATVRVFSADEEASLVQESQVRLVARTPIELGLNSLERGVYTVTVDSETPFVAAAWQASGVEQFEEFALMTSASTVQGELPFSVPPGPGPRLSLVNDDATAKEVRLVDLRGQVQTIVVLGQAAIVVPLEAASSYTLIADAPVYASVIMGDEKTIAGWPLWPVADRAGAIVVYP